MSGRKQTMHDRFLAGEQRRATERNVLVKAAEERAQAQQMLKEAKFTLYSAERKLEEAQLIREDWMAVRLDYWTHSIWRHRSGSEMVRIDPGDADAYWAVWVDGGAYERMATNTFPELEQAMECCRLRHIHMGRYPEPPPKGLFERLRNSV